MRSTIVFFLLVSMKFGNQRLLSTGVHGKNIMPWNLLHVRVRREIHYKRNERNSHTNSVFFFLNIFNGKAVYILCVLN